MSGKGILWLVGMSGVGKSSIGRLAGEWLGWRFVDLDHFVEERAGGRKVTEIFAAEGETRFRARELDAVRELVGRGGPLVVASGGGTATTPEALAEMRRSGLLVWVRSTVDEILTRIDVSKRPLLADHPEPRAKLLEHERARERFYARADLAIDRWSRPSPEVAEELVALVRAYGDAPLAPPDHAGVREEPVELGARSYPVLVDDAADGPEHAAARFAHHLARRAPPGRAAIGLVVDKRVQALHGARYLAALHKRGFSVVEVVVPEGEAQKALAEAGRVAEAFAAGGLDRRSTVVALGGGATGDLAGFVASSFLRGVGFVAVPTTLLAQVDASVGGKTAVNLPSGKNLVGSFHQPRLVYIDLSTLATLERRDVASGLAEIAKHALLDGNALLELLEGNLDRAARGEPALLAELVRRSVAHKARVVEGDERELRPAGGRALLNLGHTVGHALEAASHEEQKPLRHGEAVALGLVAAMRVGHALGGGDLEPRVTVLLARLGLPVDLDRRLDAPALARVAVDKKRAGSVVRFVVLDRPGAARLVSLPPERLAEILLPAVAGDRPGGEA